jgi:hypothetical protein
VATGLARHPSPARQTAYGIVRPLPPVSSSTQSPPAPRHDALEAADPNSTRDRPGTAAGRMKAADLAAAATTQLRCGGCHAHALYAQDESCYGQLVRAFLGQHELCGNAVKITCVRGGQN